MTESPPVPPEHTFGFEHCFCSRHGEPFRAEYPKGYIVTSVQLFHDVLQLDATDADAKKESGGETYGPEDLKKILARKPACCRVSQRRLLELYAESGIGVLARCRVCRRKAVGAPYTTQQRGYDHVCFDCVVYGQTTEVN